MKAFALCILVSVALTGCSSSQTAEKSDAAPKKGQDSEADAKKKSPKKKTGGAKTGDDKEGDSDGGDGSTAGGANCRTFQDSFDTHSTVSGKVTAPLIGAINITVDADMQVIVESDDQTGSLAIPGTVTGAKPALAKATAERGLSAYADPMVMDYIGLDQQGSLEGWKGLDCLVMGATTLKNDKFDYEFSPALPLLVNPNGGDDADFDRTITGIKSTIRRHFEQSNGATPGSYDGKAVLSKSGKSYRIEFDFGSGAPNIFATPIAAIEYELDDNGKYAKITAWIWISATEKLPVPLQR